MIRGTLIFVGAFLGLAVGAGVLRAENLNAPSISGELVDFKREIKTAVFTPNHAKIEVVPAATSGQSALQVTFEPGVDYPNVVLTGPGEEGWNLSSFAGVAVKVELVNGPEVKLGVRLDNPGDWHEKKYNQETATLQPGKTRTIEVTFGRDFGQPGYALDPTQVLRVQLFAAKPAATVTVKILDIRAFGSPEEQRINNAALTTPADRTQPVALPDWLGSRPPVEGDWVKTFEENFDGPKLNEKVWNTEAWWGNGQIPEETERYSRDNLFFEKGILRFKCEKRSGHQYDRPDYPFREYTTAYINSYGKFAQCYGYFEARIKPPAARGLWPAFWLMPDRGPGYKGDRTDTADNGMEFDIMELLTEWGPGRTNVALHWDGYQTDHRSWGSNQVYFGSTPDGWHVWGLLWEPGQVTWYIDGIKKAEFRNARVASVPAFPILNVQMGGWATKDVDEAKLPDYMEVDYVRVWQRKERLSRP